MKSLSGFMLSGLMLLSPLSQAQSLTFAAYGDMPYSKLEQQLLAEDVSPVIRTREEIRFVINVGDLGRPQSACQDRWLRQTRALWAAMQKPVFYTPGDNDWTDCDRDKLPQPASELQRLQAIRDIMFQQPVVSESHWQYQQQADFPENQRWMADNILFVTQHLVGTQNGRRQILRDDNTQALEQVKQRDQANQRWLKQAVLEAEENHADALVIAMQVDLFGQTHQALERCLNNPAFRPFCQQLNQQIAALDIPVLLIHGDSTPYCMDQPLKQQAPQLWRLNVPGDYLVSDVALVTVEPKHKTQPFQVTSVLDQRAPDSGCTP